MALDLEAETKIICSWNLNDVTRFLLFSSCLFSVKASARRERFMLLGKGLCAKQGHAMMTSSITSYTYLSMCAGDASYKLMHHAELVPLGIIYTPFADNEHYGCVARRGYTLVLEGKLHYFILNFKDYVKFVIRFDGVLGIKTRCARAYGMV